MQDIKKYAEYYYVQSKKLTNQYDILMALCCAVVVILLGFCLGLRNDEMISSRLGGYVHYSLSNPMNIFVHWDGKNYINIAKHGYRNLLDAGFFPFYPLVIRAIYYIVRSYILSALTISWVSLVGAIYFYIKIIKHLGLVSKESNIPLAIAPFVLFPTAVFMMVSYTEGLFALLALASIYFAFKKRYLLVGLFIMLALLTHITGAFLVILDGLILLEGKLPIKKVLFSLVIGSFGLLIFMSYSYLRFHNALIFLKSQTHIHGWLHLSYLRLLSSMTYLNALFAALLIVSAIYFWNKRRSFSIYSLLFLLIPLIGTQWGGFNRYVIMAFPIPIMIYQYFKGKQTYMFIVILTAIFWTYTLLQYAAGFISS